MEDDCSEGLANEELLNAKEKDIFIFTAAARVWHSEFADLACMEVEQDSFIAVMRGILQRNLAEKENPRSPNTHIHHIRIYIYIVWRRWSS